MPSSIVHGHITRTALSLLPFDTGDNSGLINDYCSYPDTYFEEPQKYAKYHFALDGIQYHYPPNTPIYDLYRYWQAPPDGLTRSSLTRPRKFVNENHIHMKAGFLFYIRHALEELRNGNMEEAKKFLGCMIHALQDASIGLHTVEGPGGSDAFLLDRMWPCTPAPSHRLANITSDKCHPTNYTPCSLGTSDEEIAMRLYSKYVCASDDSRKAAFQYLLELHNGHDDTLQPLVQRMFDNGVRLTADVLYTLLSNASIPAPQCLPTDLEPVVFPFGGFKPYVYSSCSERGTALALDGSPLPLELNTHSGRRCFESGLAFGSHIEGDLLFDIAPNVFHNIMLFVGFHPDVHFGTANVRVINDGNVIHEELIDNAALELPVKEPSGIFGITFKSSSDAGTIVLATEQI